MAGNVAVTGGVDSVGNPVKIAARVEGNPRGPGISVRTAMLPASATSDQIDAALKKTTTKDFDPLTDTPSGLDRA